MRLPKVSVFLIDKILLGNAQTNPGGDGGRDGCGCRCISHMTYSSCHSLAGTCLPNRIVIVAARRLVVAPRCLTIRVESVSYQKNENTAFFKKNKKIKFIKFLFFLENLFKQINLNIFFIVFKRW